MAGVKRMREVRRKVVVILWDPHFPDRPKPSVTAVRNRDGLLPLRARRVLSIVYTDDYDPVAGRAFQRELATGIERLNTATITGSADADRLVLSHPARQVGRRGGPLLRPAGAGRPPRRDRLSLDRQSYVRRAGPSRESAPR